MWTRIEEIYGNVPELIKVILEVNGFDSFLALKGIRYDDKKEFFESLEETVSEILTSSEDSTEMRAIQKALNGSCSDFKKFKLKPGHRNFIMNLMIEIESTDSNHFFQNDPFNKINSKDDSTPKVSDYEFPLVQIKSLKDIKTELNQSEDEDDHFMYKSVVDDGDQPVTIKTEKPEEIVTEILHEIQSQEMSTKIEPPDQSEIITEEEAVIAFEGDDDESEFSMEEYIDALKSFDGDMTGSYILEIPSNVRFNRQKQKESNEVKKKSYSKPERMYNDEFMALKLNPRKRRITTSKLYPNTVEGIRARFRDLIKQSLNYILSREEYLKVHDKEIELIKESDTCWTCTCPICGNRIKLAIHYENNGRYCNYKRSNFERHLRFKHCGSKKKTSNNYISNLPSLPTKETPKIVLYPQPSNSKPLPVKISDKSCTDSAELVGLK